ncbi:transposase [Acidobacteriia bacterium AH_259_A11_L15]|nr:transposase [Acidobacteriia bacterium AH_259_A11_L15]
MSRIPGTYFVTSNTWQRRPLFRKEQPARLFLDCLFHYRNEGNFLLHEFVLMPDHFHLLLTPAPAVTLERALQLIKGGSSHRIRHELRYQFPIWQTAFDDHRIRSVRDYKQRQAYIWNNPVTKKLVAKPEEYAFSSASPQYKSLVDVWSPELTSAAKAEVAEPMEMAALKRGPDK